MQAWGLRSDTLLQPSWSGISVKPSSQSGRAEDGLKHLLFSTQAAGATWRHPWTQAGEKDQPGWGLGRQGSAGAGLGWGGAWPGAGAQAAWSLPLLPCAQTGPWGGRVGAAPLLEEGLSSDARLGLLGLVLRLGRWEGGRSAVREWAVDQSPAAHCPLPKA